MIGVRPGNEQRRLSRDIRSAISKADLETVMKLLEESPMRDAQILSSHNTGLEARVDTNDSVFHISGVKLVWGDISLKDIEDWTKLTKKYSTTIFILTERNGYYKIPDEAITVLNPMPADDPFSKSRLRNLLPPEAVLVNPEYVERSAWIKIADGVCYQSEFTGSEVTDGVSNKWSESKWNDYKAFISGRRV